MTTAAKPAAVASPLRPLKPIEPNAITTNSRGFAWNEHLVRLHRDMTIADVVENPSIWKLVQGSAKPMQKLDKLLIVAFDESWAAECMVSSANDVSVVISKPRITELTPRAEALFQDGTYMVKWDGIAGGYIVVRMRDQQVMTLPRLNAALAERDLRDLYPTRAA